MKVVANHLCPVCGSCYRKSMINKDGKTEQWCTNPKCKARDKHVLLGVVKRGES